MNQFKPCVSKSLCTEGGEVCKSCGRPHWHIDQTRQLINDMAEFILQADFENVEEFTAYLASKAQKKVAARRKQ